MFILIVMVMVVLVLMLILILIVMVMVVLMFILIIMMVSAATFLTVVVMVVFMLIMLMGLVSRLCQHLKLKVGYIFHCRKNLGSLQFIPRCGYYVCRAIQLAHHFNDHVKPFSRHVLCTAQNHRSSMLNLVVEKLPEILHVHLRLGGIHNC